MTQLAAYQPGADLEFELLYRHHADAVYRYALGVLKNPGDAEDVTQTTFLNAYRAYRRGEEPRASRGWLIAIARNVCRQRFRQLSRRPKELALNGDLTPTLVDHDGPSLDDVVHALRRLTTRQRAAFVMRELEGRSYPEIAETLGLTTGALETLLVRARRAIREQLEGELSCTEAELAVAEQLAGTLSPAEKRALRAHLRECRDCTSLARRRRAKAGLRGLAVLPFPSSLASLFGGGSGGAGGVAAGGALGGGLAAKAAVVLAGGAVAAGVGYETVQRAPWRPAPPSRQRVAPPAASRAPALRATQRVAPSATSHAPALRATGVRTAPASVTAPMPLARPAHAYGRSALHGKAKPQGRPAAVPAAKGLVQKSAEFPPRSAAAAQAPGRRLTPKATHTNRGRGHGVFGAAPLQVSHGRGLARGHADRGHGRPARS